MPNSQLGQSNINIIIVIINNNKQALNQNYDLRYYKKPSTELGIVISGWLTDLVVWNER